jgi:hypothetical protein
MACPIVGHALVARRDRNIEMVGEALRGIFRIVSKRMGGYIENTVLRLIHNLGGCGGTLLSRCLGLLPDVALLSEVNPASVKLYPSFDPVYQDRMWLRLLSQTDAERFAQMDLGEADTFRDMIQAFYDRARASHRHLVIRDYNYIEFIGAPFTTDPPRRLLIHAALPHAIPTASVALIRHPINQWLSLRKHWQPGSVAVKPQAFCLAYAMFLRELGTKAIFKYEEFVDNPERELRAICRELDLQFVPSFIEGFHQFDYVTGDLTRLRDRSISQSERKPVPQGALEEFRSSEIFHFILAKTGYSDSV